MSSPRTLIIGCGYFGQYLAHDLRSKNHEVFGTTRSSVRAQLLKEAGITPVIFDLQDLSSLEKVFPCDYVVISLAPTGGDNSSYDYIYHHGLSRIVDFLDRMSPLQKLVYTSSIGVYEQSMGEWVDENTPVIASSDRRKALIQAEEAICRSKSPSIVVRLGGIYGPRRNRINDVKNGIPIVDSDQFVNLVHVEDAAKITSFLMNSLSTSGIFIAVDSLPVKRSDMFAGIVKLLQLPESSPERVDPEETPHRNKRCSNQKLLSLGYEFVYPTFIEGYQSLIKQREIL